jgi:hypothetical protein
VVIRRINAIGKPTSPDDFNVVNFQLRASVQQCSSPQLAIFPGSGDSMWAVFSKPQGLMAFHNL